MCGLLVGRESLLGGDVECESGAYGNEDGMDSSSWSINSPVQRDENGMRVLYERFMHVGTRKGRKNGRAKLQGTSLQRN